MIDINCDVFVFGKLDACFVFPAGKEYNISSEFEKYIKEKTQIVVHRDELLMYYGYVRKIEAEKYIGFCVTLNDAQIENIEKLFAFFEMQFEKVFLQKYVKINQKGEEVVEDGYEKADKWKDIYVQICKDIRADIDKIDWEIKCPLPSDNLAKESSSFATCGYDEQNDVILELIKKNSYIAIYKSEGYDSKGLSEYKSVLSSLLERNTELENLNGRLKRQKKNTKVVVVLLCVVLLSVMGLMMVIKKLHKVQENLIQANNKIEEQVEALSNTCDALMRANDTIGMQADMLVVQTDTITELHHVNKKLSLGKWEEQKRREKVENELELLSSNMREKKSMIVKDMNFNYRNGTLEVMYYGLKEVQETVQIRATGIDTVILCDPTLVYIHSGSHSMFLQIGEKLKKDKEYVFDFVEKDVER